MRFIHQICTTFLNHTGCLIISLSASHSPTTYSLDDLVRLSQQPSNILFLIVYFILILFLLSIAFGCIFRDNDRLKGYNYTFTLLLHSLAFGIVAGSLSGNQVFIKSLSTIISAYSYLHSCDYADISKAFLSTRLSGFTTVCLW